MTDVFPAEVGAPSYSPQCTPAANIEETPFGDGYTQKVEKGLNPVADVWQVPWNNLDNDKALILIAFLKAHLTRPFLWTAPRELVAKKFTCVPGSLSYFPSRDSLECMDVSASFKQDFNPG